MTEDLFKMVNSLHDFEPEMAVSVCPESAYFWLAGKGVTWPIDRREFGLRFAMGRGLFFAELRKGFWPFGDLEVAEELYKIIIGNTASGEIKEGALEGFASVLGWHFFGQGPLDEFNTDRLRDNGVKVEVILDWARRLGDHWRPLVFCWPDKFRSVTILKAGRLPKDEEDFGRMLWAVAKEVFK